MMHRFTIPFALFVFVTAIADALPQSNKARRPTLQAGSAEHGLRGSSEGIASIQSRPASSFRRPVLDRVSWDFDPDSGHWARGLDFKTCSSEDGFQFHPFLGSDAPRNYPVRFRLREVTRGGERLAIDSVPTVRRTHDRCVFDHGAVEVRYDHTLGSVEQSFELDANGGAGDLRISLDVDTELESFHDGERWRFENERGGVSYGAAIAFDDEGRSTPVTTQRSSTGLDLVVPAAFLEGIEGRVIIDPIVQTFTIHDWAVDIINPDVAYESVHDVYCVVDEIAFSIADHDIFSWFVDPSTGMPFNAVYVDITSAPWRRPSIASQRVESVFLIVAERENGSSISDIYGRFRNADGSGMAPTFELKDSAGPRTHVRALASGDNYPSSPSYFCVAFHTDNEEIESRIIRMMIVDTSASVLVERSWGVSADLCESLSISKSTGDASGPTEFIIGWTARTGPTLFDTAAYWAALVSFNGASVTGPSPVASVPASTTDYGGAMAVSSLSNRTPDGGGDPFWLLTNARAKFSVTPEEHVLELHLMSGLTEVFSTELEIIEHANKDYVPTRSRIATVADSFVVHYGSSVPQQQLAAVVEPVGDRLAVVEQTFDVLDSRIEGRMATTSRFEGGAPAGAIETIACWARNVAGEEQIEGALLDAVGSGGLAGNQYCYGVPNSTGQRAFVTALGNRNVNHFKILAALRLPANSVGLWLAATDAIPAQTIGGGTGSICVGGSIGRFAPFDSGPDGVTAIGVDPMMIAQPTGPTAAMSGSSWHFQAWHRDMGTMGPTSNLTNAVRILFE